jgi:hypothetical protein
VVDLPALLDTFIGYGHAGALVGGGILGGELDTRNAGISG